MNYAENIPVSKLDEILSKKIAEYNKKEVELMQSNKKHFLLRIELNSLATELSYLSGIELLTKAKEDYINKQAQEKELLRKITVIKENINTIKDDIDELNERLRSKILGKDILIELNKSKNRDEEIKRATSLIWTGTRTEFVSKVLDEFIKEKGINCKQHKLFLKGYFHSYRFPNFPEWTFQKFDSAFRVAKSLKNSE